MKSELKYQKKQSDLQNSQYRILTLIFNENMRKLAKVISQTKIQNTNSNPKLKKSFTELKRELRKSVEKQIDNSIYKGRDFADKKDIEFKKEVENVV